MPASIPVVDTLKSR